MSRKIDPMGLRVGITLPWMVTWYAEGKEYGNNIIEDDKLRKFTRKALRNAGVAAILIERSIKNIKLTIQVAKPGIVIGRKGAGLNILRQGLSKLTKRTIDIQVEEVAKPDLSAPVVADTIAQGLERRMHFKRAMNMAADKTIEAGAKGVRVEVAGTIHGPNSVAMTEVVVRKAVPNQTLRADIDYAKSTAFTRGGTLGIKVWIYRGEIKEAVIPE